MADNIDTKPAVSQETREKYHNAEQLGRAKGTFKHIIQVGAIKDEYGYINNFIYDFLDRETNK